VTKTWLALTEAILCWKWSRNFSRYNCWNLFNGNLSTTKLHRKLFGSSLLTSDEILIDPQTISSKYGLVT